MQDSQATSPLNRLQADPLSGPLRPSTERLGLALLVGISAVLRFLFLTRKSFWFDEGFGVEVARLDWLNFARILWRREGNMALYYLMLRGWMLFGHGEFLIRSLSVGFSLATVPVIYWLGRRLFDWRTGLIAATLLTFNAYHIRYAQEARSYSLLVLLGTLSSAFFVEFLLQPSRGNRLWYVLTSSLAVYAHLYAIFLIIAQYLSLYFLDLTDLRGKGVLKGMKGNWRWVAGMIFPAVLFVCATGLGPLNWIRRPGFAELSHYYEYMAGNGGMVLLLAYVIAASAALIPVGSRLVQRRSAWKEWKYQFLLLWLFLPVILTVAISVARPIFLPRYFLFCLPAFILLASSGIARLPGKWAMAPVFLVVALSLRGTRSYYDHDFDLNRDDWRTATSYVLNHALPGDAIMFQMAGERMPYEFYRSLFAGSSAAPVVIYPSHGSRLDFRDFMGRPSAQFLETVPSTHERVWVVLKDNEDEKSPDPTVVLLDHLFGGYSRVDEKPFPWLEVRLYSRQQELKERHTAVAGK